jgi:hypothetical protein
MLLSSLESAEQHEYSKQYQFAEPISLYLFSFAIASASRFCAESLIAKFTSEVYEEQYE